MTSPTLLQTLQLCHLPELTPGRLGRWLQCLGGVHGLLTADDSRLLAAGASPTLIEQIRRIAAGMDPDLALHPTLRWAELPHQHLVGFDDDAYPLRLKGIPSPPPLLYVKGDLAPLCAAQLAIVGARAASPAGRRFAFNYAQALAQAGLVITSGLASGIDAQGHLGAMAGDGITVGVLGTGVDRVYPRTHRQLAERIIDRGGTLVSELPLGTPPRASHFPQRNRIISGMSLGVLVVEAALDSGSLITARCALDQGREVFAVPGPPDHLLSRGCHELIRQGAMLVDSPALLLTDLITLASRQKIDWLPALPGSGAGSQILLFGLNDTERQVYAALSHEPQTIDGLLVTTGLTLPELNVTLSALELRGHIGQLGARFRRLGG